METISFNEVYSTYSKEVLNFINYKVRNSIISEEICNDAFMKLYNNLAHYNSEKASIKTWLFTIVNNTVIDYMRATKKEHLKTAISVLNEQRKTPFDVLSTDKSIVDELGNKDLGRAINKSIDKLIGINKSVTKMYFFDDMKYHEIAEALCISLDNVKVIIHRVRKDLQGDLRKQDVFI